MIGALLFVWGFQNSFAQEEEKQSLLVLEPHERLVTILGTNDIHGGVEPVTDRFGKNSGGLAGWAGTVKAIREGLKNQYQERAGVVLVDGGDQFQGTLISNFNEGKLVYDLMNQIAYAAVVPGNHAYDFGPTGWLDDRVNERNPDKNKRGALDRLIEKAQFKLLSANVFYKRSLKGANGECLSEEELKRMSDNRELEKNVQWDLAERPSFLKPYHIESVAGLRVAIIGIENGETPTTTTPENVDDLYFKDEASSYLEIREQIKDQADLFILVIHDGDASVGGGGTRVLKKLVEHGPGTVHAVIAGHTHFVNNLELEGVPLIQSGSGGTRYGRIDLVWNDQEKKLSVAKTRKFAGVFIREQGCAPAAEVYCKEDLDGSVLIEGVKFTPDASIQAKIQEAKAGEYGQMANRKLGHAEGSITRDRISESALVNQIADAFRKVAVVGETRAQVAFINGSGIRANLIDGDVNYADFFELLPFNNRAVVIGPMPALTMIGLLEKSVKTCGSYGALFQSGLQVEFQRDCEGNGNVDSKAKLLLVKTLDGEILFDDSKGGLIVSPDRTFQVTTFDFLHAGGSGYDGFIGTPLIADLGVLREVLTEAFLKEPFHFTSATDGRWKQIKK